MEILEQLETIQKNIHELKRILLNLQIKAVNDKWSRGLMQ